MDRERTWKYSRTARNYNTTSDESSDSSDSEGNAERENPDVTMDPDQLAALLNTLGMALGRVADNNEAMRVLLAQQQHQQQQQQQQPPQPQPQAAPEPKIDSKTFPELKLTGSEAEKMSQFIAWDKGVRNTLIAIDAMNRLPVQRVAHAILASFRDEAARQASAINGNNYANIDDLLDALQTLFCGAAIRQKSYNLFSEAKQESNEDLNTYWTRLQSLWLRAFEEADRSEAQLIRTFVGGLRNQKLVEKLITRDAGLPQNYVQLREVALQIAGQLETVELMRAGKKPNWNPAAGGGGIRGGPVPMEVGAAGRVPRGNGGNAGGRRGAVATVNPGGTQPRLEKDQCRRCKKKGHWAKDCPNRDKPARGFVGNVEREELVDGTQEDEGDEWADTPYLQSDDEAGNA